MRRPGMALIWLLLTAYLIALTTTEFSRIPEAQTISIGSDAVFKCQHPTALSIGWLLNGVSVNQINDSGMDLTQGTSREEDDSLVYTLTIFACPKYNETMVECVATFLTKLPQRSPPVILIIEDTCGTLTITTTFTIIPRLGIFADGSEARFRCHHRTNNRIAFEIDGLSINETLGQNASVVTIPAGNGRSVFILTFEAVQVLDGSMIVCVAVFTNGCPNQETLPALLLIQGPLSAVSRFRRIPSNPLQVVYSWTPPPTLDLTGVSPDVIYNIEVYNITCGANDLLSRLHNLNVSLYQNSLLDPGHVYKVVIVPRSNVPGAKNGTTFIEYERFGEMNVSSVVLMENSSGVVIEFGLQSSVDIVNIHARWYSLFIYSMHMDLKPEEPVIVEVGEEVDTSVRVLPRRQLWLVKATAYDCQEHQVSTLTISTHDVQEVSARPIAGGVNVTGHFIDNSSAVGVLFITFSLTNEADIDYIFVQRPSGSQEIEISLTGFSVGDYQVAVFVVDDNGLPFNRSADLPTNVSVSQVTERANNMDEQSDISYELQPSYTGVCITCTFLTDSSTTDCVAVVHRRISQLSSSGLMNIESSHKLSRSGDTAYGCIKRVNLEQYQIGVVGGRQLISQSGVSTRDIAKIFVPVAVIVIVVVSILLLVIMILLCLHQKKRMKRHARYGGSPEAKLNTSKPTPVEDSNNSSVGLVYLKKPTMLSGTTSPQGDSNEFPTTSMTNQGSPLERDSPETSSSATEYKPIFHRRRPQTVSDTPHADVTRLATDNNKDPTLPTETTTSFGPAPRYMEEGISVQADFSNPAPSDETGTRN